MNGYITPYGTKNFGLSNIAEHFIISCFKGNETLIYETDKNAGTEFRKKI